MLPPIPFDEVKERDRLLKLLAARQSDITVLHRYYDGLHDLPKLPEGSSDDIQRLRDESILNLCPLAVDSVNERLEVTGFDFGSDADAGPVDVWDDVWQPNQLDAVSQLVHQEALIARRAFVMVWPKPNGAPGVDVTPETADEVLIDYVPGSRRVPRSMVKRFVELDDAGKPTVTDVTLWTDTNVWAWRSEGAGKALVLVEGRTGTNPLGRVPGVEFLSKPNLRGVPHSELDCGVITIQDRLNKTNYDRLVLQENQAFPQRWGIAMTVEVDKDGNPVNPIQVGPGRVTVETNPNAKLGQWDAADMGPHLAAADADIHAFAALTRTPLFYLSAVFSNVSADAIRAAEAGLVKKCLAHQRIFGEAWEQVIRLALIVLGDPRSADTSSFVAWGDAETRTVAEAADAAVKVWGKIPNQEVWRRYFGATEQQVVAWPAQIAQQALADRIATTPPAWMLTPGQIATATNSPPPTAAPAPVPAGV